MVLGSTSLDSTVANIAACMALRSSADGCFSGGSPGSYDLATGTPLIAWRKNETTGVLNSECLATDDLRGTQSYGSFDPDPLSNTKWTIPFDAAAPGDSNQLGTPIA